MTRKTDVSITRLKKILASIERDASHLREFADSFPSQYLKKGDAMDKPAILRSFSTNAKTIIDVGVNEGTPALYEAFPELRFILVDPAKNISSLVKNPPENHLIVNKAVGSQKDTLTLHEHFGQSSLLMPAGEFKTWEIREQYEVEVDRLDDIINGLGVEGPYGVKLDIEGFELDAIRGMTGIMPSIDFLICEVNIRNRAEGVYQFSDLVAELAKHDLVFFNFLNQWKPAARFYDVVFLPRTSLKFDQIA